jgi:hypothetical protein
MFKRNKVLSLALALALAFCFSSYSKADTTTDLLDPSAQNWSGTYGTGYWQGTGGPAPNRIPNNSGFIWSSDANIIGTTIAINTALEQAGIQVEGFSYKWRVKNGNGNLYGNQPGVDDFKITVDVLKADGSIYQSYVYDYGHSHNWTSHTGSETFANNYLPPSYFSDINISAQGSDSAGWTGHYGPEFNVSASEFNLNYSTNPCHENQLYNTSCLGYATAYATQQYNTNCAANALYDSGCPGYSAAYQTQQCNANPLYSTACSGYTAAYYNQQCSINALYDSGCNGYATAYFNQQCGLDTLYNSNCPGYATAYFNHQCAANPLYDSQCPGYATAYFNQQCSANTLYDSQCPGYATAYFNAQCSASALYNSQCPGYATAYFNQQCGISALYDSACSGYAQAYLAQQCAISPLYDSQCNGYALAYYNQQCTLFPANDASCSGYYTAQCDISSLFDPGCTGYQTAFVEQQCSVNPQYDQSCIGYVDLSVGTVEDVASVLEPTIQEAVNNTTQVSVPLAILALNTPAVELPVVVPVEVIVVAVPIGEPANSFDAPKETVASASVNLEDSIEREINALEEVDTTEEVVVIEEVVEVEESVSAITEDGSEEEKVVVIEEETTDKEETTEEVVVEEKIVKKPTPKKVLTKKQKAKAKAKKIKEIVQARGESLAQQMSTAATVEVQKQLQNQLLAIIGFVPDFSKYGKTNIDGGNLQQEVNLKGGRIVDHQFSRWFLNDPGFAALEEQQYNLRSN